MSMKNKFTAVIKKDADWWIGWVEEIPGVNSQGKTKVELLKNLRSALGEALEFNREDARNPQMQARPPITSGFKVIRSSSFMNANCASSGQNASADNGWQSGEIRSARKCFNSFPIPLNAPLINFQGVFL